MDDGPRDAGRRAFRSHDALPVGDGSEHDPGHRGEDGADVVAGVRPRDGALAAQRGLQVPHVLLRLLEQRAQGFSHVGQPELHGLAEPLSVTLELALFET